MIFYIRTFGMSELTGVGNIREASGVFSGSAAVWVDDGHSREPGYAGPTFDVAFWMRNHGPLRHALSRRTLLVAPKDYLK